MEVKLLSYLPNGTIINNGKYEILSPVGSGGFGHTYKAIQIDDNKLIAIKELFVDSICNRVEGSLEVVVAVASRIEQFNKLKKKFINEAKALCSYHHPHIVHAYEVFEENGTAYYSMDFIDGSPLSLVVSSHGAISESIALHYIRHIAEALAYIHDRNRLHLDVKPSNIMIDKYGNAYLIDFGTSKQYSLETNDNTTTLLAISKNYSPAEQATYGVTYFSPEMDIYALGATMYKTLSGITPPESVLLSSGIKKLQPLPDDISKPVRIAIDCAMQQEASRRPQSIQELWEIIDDMHPIQGETTVLDIFTELTKDEETSAIETMAEVTNNEKDKHESVDLGISVEWATYNVGATRPEEFGDFYAWGETDTKSNYIAENYMFQRLASKDFKRKRIIDQDNDLTPYYDVVTEEWGPEWRMPTAEA